ncbi:TonB-dependent receptor [Sphingomonas astaxanthinifaciens DSM 22298]|uniref:TonB-dependent receptor n=1 Tax=Sphingomonas astaxanthinifaciens DSM 22298 TaxID=1123267 RepID=A0ABQ5Z2P2_9SPHN|nr:TonB-dependent receptor [Sphingomonas astaxanthinifaciens DSM 22298]
MLGATALNTLALVGASFAFSSAASAQTATPTDTTAPTTQTCADGSTIPASQSCPTPDATATGQSEVATTATTPEATKEGEIVVTGSRIRRPNIESPVPVTSLTAEELTSSGDVNVGDALNDLPSIRSTYSQANSTRFIGTTGLNLLDLRGLGVTRTLVLVNGRRHVTASPGDFLVDVNTIPTDLIDRVDVITGGSSAVYGSDAVAGVVNFVLKNNYEGITLRGQGGVSDRKDRGIYTLSLTAGKNFLDDRLNVAGNLEYVKANPLYFRDRDFLTGAYSGRCQFNTAEFTTGESPFGSDGIPDQQFFCGVRNTAISNGGTLTAVAPAGGCTSAIYAPGGSAAALGAARCYNPGTPLGQVKVLNFNRNGDLITQTPLFDFRPYGSGNYIPVPGQDAPGATLRDTGQIAPGLDRYTANILTSFEVSPAFQPFFEGKYVYVKGLQEGQPSFFQSSFPAFFGAGRGIRCDNPFLDAADITALQAVGRCAGGATSTETLALGRFNIDFGGRSELVKRKTYRVVGGVRGDFNDDWNYEVAVNYGRVRINTTQRNNLITFDLDGNPDGFLLATDAVRNAAGQIVCRVNQTTVTRPDCVPINVFGFGAPSQAALDFVQTDDTFVKYGASEFNVVGYVGGDLSQLFELPGGPIRFVVGGEYRREKAFYYADPLSQAGGTFFNAFQPFNPPLFKVKEAFGEIEAPLLKDLPFAHELTVSAAGRISDYNTTAGTTKAYNLNGVWAPVRDLRFRANYSKSVRVPTLSDLYAPFSQNFAFLADPCDVLNIGSPGTNRYTNCQNQGIPLGFINAPARSQTTEISSGGNPLLTAETGKSLTLGGVFTPRFIPGFNLSVDYYRIRVNNLIATLGGQTILNLCYDLPQPNQYCGLIFPRNPDFTFASPALISGGVNYAKQKADGIDVEVGYRKQWTPDFRTDSRLIATYVLKRENYTSPTNPQFASQQLFNLGDPELAANFATTFTYKNFDLRYSVNYVGRQIIGAYENYYSFQGRDPTNADLTAEVWYPERWIQNLRLNVRVNKKYSFYTGVDNFTDQLPPLGLIGNEGGNGFDPIGRYWYAGFRADF